MISSYGQERVWPIRLDHLDFITSRGAFAGTRTEAGGAAIQINTAWRSATREVKRRAPVCMGAENVSVANRVGLRRASSKAVATESQARGVRASALGVHLAILCTRRGRAAADANKGMV